MFVFIKWTFLFFNRTFQKIKKWKNNETKAYDKFFKEYVNVQCYIECTLQLIFQFYLLNYRYICNLDDFSIFKKINLTIYLNLFAILVELTYLCETKWKISLVKSSILVRFIILLIVFIRYFVVLIPRLLLLTLFFLVIIVKLKNFTYTFIFCYVNFSLFLIINLVEFSYQRITLKNRVKENIMKLFGFKTMFIINFFYSLLGFNWFFTFSFNFSFTQNIPRCPFLMKCLRTLFEIIFFAENMFLLYFFNSFYKFENSEMAKFYIYFIFISSFLHIFLGIVIYYLLNHVRKLTFKLPN